MKIWREGPNKKTWAIHGKGVITLSLKDKFKLLIGQQIRWSLCYGVIAHTDDEGRLDGDLDSVIYYSKVVVSEPSDEARTQEAVFDSEGKLHEPKGNPI